MAQIPVSRWPIVAALVVIELGLLGATSAAHDSKHNPGAQTCRLLESKYIDSQSWIEFPIIYQPITRGRLTIWSGLSTLPSSEFACQVDANDTRTIQLNFVSFSEKLEWTLYDLNRDTTYNGFSVNERENVKFRVTIESAKSYLGCNTIEAIEMIFPEDDNGASLRTVCSECDASVLAVINSQIRQLIKLRLDQQIVDELAWHLTEMISNQNSAGPIHFES